jgi:hypothetical protein
LFAGPLITNPLISELAGPITEYSPILQETKLAAPLMLAALLTLDAREKEEACRNMKWEDKVDVQAVL